MWSSSNGYGSGNTRVRKYTTNDYNINVGATTEAAYCNNDATTGLVCTIYLPGTYCFSYTEVFNSSEDFGLTLNSVQGSTDVTSATSSTILAMGATVVADQPQSVSWCGHLNSTEFVWPHTRAAGASSVVVRSRFLIDRQ